MDSNAELTPPPGPEDHLGVQQINTNHALGSQESAQNAEAQTSPKDGPGEVAGNSVQVDQAFETSKQDVSFPAEQDNASPVDSNVEPYSAQVLPKAMGIGLQKSNDAEAGSPDGGEHTPSSPTNPMNTAGRREENSNLPRMQIKLPPPTLDEAADLSPMVDTNSHNIIMNRKLDSDNAQSQDLQHNNIHSSEQPMSSASVYQSLVPQNKNIDFDTKSPNQSQLEAHNQSPQTLRQSARQFDDKPEKIQIGAKVISNMAEIDSFARQVANRKVAVGPPGAPAFHGEPIMFENYNALGHCGHCAHFNFIDINEYKFECAAETCCRRDCSYDRSLTKRNEVAFIDYSSSIDHTAELQATYRKYKQVINRLKNDFILFSQKQPMRRSVAEVPLKKSYEPEAQTIMDMLTKAVLEQPDKKKSNTEGMAARLTGRVQQKDKEQSKSRRTSVADGTQTRRTHSTQGKSSQDSPRRQQPIRINVSHKQASSILSQEQNVSNISHTARASERNVILLGIDGKVSKFFLNQKGSPYKVEMAHDHQNNETTESLEQRAKESKQNLKLNSTKMGKLQQKSNNKNIVTKSTARNQDIIDTIEDAEKGANRYNASEMNSSPINQLKFSKVATQYRNNESNDGNINQELNDRQSIKEETQQANSPQSTSQEQLLGSLKSMNKYNTDHQNKDKYQNAPQSPTSFQQQEDPTKKHQMMTSMAPGTSLTQYRRHVDDMNQVIGQPQPDFDKGGLTTPQEITNSLGNTKSPNDRSEQNQQNELQLAIYGLLDSQDEPGSRQRPTKESIRKSGESERIESFQDAEKTATLSRTQDKREGDDENNFASVIQNRPSKQSARQRGTVDPKELTLQMEAIRHGSTKEAGHLATKQRRELNMGKFFKKQLDSPEYERARGEAVKGLTNQHKKRVNMPFSHFVHPQSPPTIGSVSSNITSSLRHGRLNPQLQPVEDFVETRGILKQKYNGQIESPEQASEYKNANAGMNSSTLQRQSHETYKHLQQKSTTMNILSDENGQWDASTLQEKANAVQSHNVSRSNSAAKQEQNPAKQVIVVQGQPIHQGQTIQVTSFEESLIDGVDERFRNKGIATKISRALEQGASLVNSLEQSDPQAQRMLNDLQRKEDNNLIAKKVQFKIDMKSRSISRSDSKARRSDANKQSRMSEQFAVVDAEQMSFEKRIEESCGNNNRKALVALRDLHAKWSNSLDGSANGSTRAVDPRSYRTGTSKQNIKEPISMKSKTNFMKKIKIGGKNEALRQLLDHTIKCQAYKAANSEQYGVEIAEMAKKERARAQMARHINAEGLEVIFQSTAQPEDFDPQLDQTVKMMHQAGPAQATSPLSTSPNTIKENRKETELDRSKMEGPHRMQAVNGHSDKSGAQLHLQNSMIKKAIKRDSKHNLSPSETQGSPENLMVKTMTFENQDADNNFAFQSTPDNGTRRSNERKQKIIVTKMDADHARHESTTKQSQPKLLQPLGSETDSLYVKKRRVQKKKTSNILGGSTLNVEDRHQKKNHMNLDIIDQATRGSQRGSQKRMEINGSHAARRATNRDLKNETGFEKVKFKSIDIQVQSHRSRRRRSKSPPDDFNQMSSIDREETIQELIAIESQLAALLKDPNNVSTRRYRRVPKERLLNTLRQYVFEQSFKNNQESYMPGGSERGASPHDFIEIVGSNTQIQKQRHIQKLHNNRMEFVKYIEFLGQNKKRTHSKYWQLSEGTKIEDSVKKDQDKTACLDFQQFNNLIKKMDNEQESIHGKQIELVKLQEQVLKSEQGKSNKEATKSLTDSLSQPPELKMTLHSESQTEFYQVCEKDPNMSGDLMLYVTQKGYLLHQPKNQMKRYANQRLLSQDHIFLNEEQIIKNNIFNENFYKIREANKITTHLDMVENKLLDKMKTIKIDEHRKRQKLVSAGKLDEDVHDASDAIKVERRPAEAPEYDQAEVARTTTIIYSKDEQADDQDVVSLINQLDEMIKEKTNEIKSTSREPILHCEPVEKEEPIPQDSEAGAISQSQVQSQQPSTKVIMSSTSIRSKPGNESTLKMKELEPQANLEDIQSTVRRETSTNQMREAESRGEQGEMDLKVDIQVKEASQLQALADSNQIGNELQELKEVPMAPSTSSAGQRECAPMKRGQKVVRIKGASRPTSDAGSACVERVQEAEAANIPQRAETSSSMKTTSIFNRDRLRFQSMLDFRNKQRVTRQSIAHAFKDNYILADLKTRYAQKVPQQWQQNARLSTQGDSRPAGRNTAHYSTIQTGDCTLAPDFQKAQTCMQSVNGSIDDENPLSDLNDSVLEHPDANTRMASCRPALDDQPNGPQNWFHFDSILEAKRVDHAHHTVDYDKRGVRDSIQSQQISERRLQNLDFVQPRQSIDLKTNQLNSPLLHKEKIKNLETAPISAVLESRRRHGTSYTMSQDDVPSGWSPQLNEQAKQYNWTDYGQIAWPKATKKDGNMYLNYVDCKKPLLPALITNQIRESKRRHLIESGVAQSVDLGSTNRRQLSTDYRASNATGRDFAGNPKNLGTVRQSVALSTLSKKMEKEVDFSKDFELDSARLFNHDLFLQRSKRRSVTKGLQAGEQLRTQFHGQALTAAEQRRILNKILGASHREPRDPQPGQKPLARLHQKYLHHEAELSKQKQAKATDRTSKHTFQRPVDSGDSHTVLPGADPRALPHPSILGTPQSTRPNNAEYTFNITQEPSRLQTAQQSEHELRRERA